MPIKPQKRTLRPSRIFICVDCKKQTSTKAPNIKRCKKCRRKRLYIKNEVETRICDYCSDEFETTRGWARFCTAKCRSAYHRERYEADLLKVRLELDNAS